MPISLSQLTANRKYCRIAFEGITGELNIEYYPMKLTGKMVADFAAANPENMKAMATEQVVALVSSPTKVLLELLAGWDMTAVEDGPVLPIDEPTLAGLGITVQWTILTAIMSDGNGSGKVEAPTASRSKRR